MSRMIAFAGIINARDLGGLTTIEGKTIRKGLLLRTANLSQATEADLSKLRQDYRLAGSHPGGCGVSDQSHLR